MTTVGLNLLWLRPGVVGGTEEYVTRLLRAMAENPVPGIELHLFASTETADVHRDLFDHFHHRTCRLPHGHPSVRIPAEVVWLPRAARDAGCAVVHHLGGTVPPGASDPHIVTVYDLQPLIAPERFSPVKRRYLARRIPRAAATAARVVTISEWARSSLVDRLGIDRDRTAVVAPPAPVTVQPSPAEIADRRRAEGLAGDYFLYPAIAYEHKNHRVVLEALSDLLERGRVVDLVLTGAPGPFDREINEQVGRLDLGRNVHRLGRIDRRRLDTLIAGAAAMVFPSRFEGFGQPVVEAMALGCPVIAADATALPETVGGSGELVDPDDSAAWANAMSARLDDPAGRAAAGATVDLARFSAARSAAAQQDVYRGFGGPR